MKQSDGQSKLYSKHAENMRSVKRLVRPGSRSAIASRYFVSAVGQFHALRLWEKQRKNGCNCRNRTDNDHWKNGMSGALKRDLLHIHTFQIRNSRLSSVSVRKRQRIAKTNCIFQCNQCGKPSGTVRFHTRSFRYRPMRLRAFREARRRASASDRSLKKIC